MLICIQKTPKGTNLWMGIFLKMKTMMRILLKESNFEGKEDTKSEKKKKDTFSNKKEDDFFSFVVMLLLAVIVVGCLYAYNEVVKKEDYTSVLNITDNLIAQTKYVICDDNKGNIAKKDIEEVYSDLSEYSYEIISEVSANDELNIAGTPIYYDFYDVNDAVLFTLIRYKENDIVTLVSVNNSQIYNYKMTLLLGE